MGITDYTDEFRPLVLVADDDDGSFSLIEVIIGKKCRVVRAKNGIDVVELFKQNQSEVAAILMDIKMPIMNGYEAMKIIRSISAHIPIIAQTAYAFEEDRLCALKCGATDVLVKPIVLSALRNCLSKYLPAIQW